jgi:hypothetical protein
MPQPDGNFCVPRRYTREWELSERIAPGRYVFHGRVVSPVPSTCSVGTGTDLRGGAALGRSCRRCPERCAPLRLVCLVRLPGAAAWPPGWHGTLVDLVLRAELAAQGRLLVPMDERGHGGARGRGVQQEGGLAKYQRLPDDGGHDRQVHGVADVAVEPADDQVLGRGRRCGGAGALGDEPREGALAPRRLVCRR